MKFSLLVLVSPQKNLNNIQMQKQSVSYNYTQIDQINIYRHKEKKGPNQLFGFRMSEILTWVMLSFTDFF